MKLKNKKCLFLSAVITLLVLIVPTVVRATSSLELFPASFEQTINLHAADPTVIIARIINATLLFLGIIAVLLILYGGFLWMTSAGNEEKIDRAKKLLVSTAIGLLIILSSFALARFVISRLVDSLGGGGGITSEEACATCSVPTGPSSGSFLVKSISPRGSVPLRNVTARVVLNRAPAPGGLENNVVVSAKTDNAVVSGRLEISGTTIKFTPEAPCPAPNQDRKCFAAETDFKIEVKSTLKSVDGRGLTCLGLNSPCEAEFHTGSLVDTAPPQVNIEAPDNGEAFSVDTCVLMQAKVVDDTGVGSADFYADNNLIDSASPIEETSPKQTVLEIPCWDTTGLPTPSWHNLSVTAFDIDANQATSTKVKVAVRPSHCFNGVKDDGEDDVDCSRTTNGPSGCGLCDGGSCEDNADCAGGLCDGTTKTCLSYPKITSVTPGDGAEGTMVSLSGLNFGGAPGTVFFSNNVSAQPPAACDPKSSWTPRQIIVGVPAGAVDGPIKVCTAAGLCDLTNDARGSMAPTHNDNTAPDGAFDVNNAVHPGLCRAFSPTPNTACQPSDPQANAKCQNENKDAAGNPDKTAFCHPQKRYCVFPKGRWNATVYLEGKQFGQSKGNVIFGDGAARQPNVWQADGQAETVLPPLNYGMTKVQILAASGAPSNAVDYIVLSPDANTLPVIVDINPGHGGPGTGLTIQGNNFGQEPGLVWFAAPDGQQVQADIDSLPAECAKSGAWWTQNYITVKVPKVLDINDVNKNNNKTEVLQGSYQVFVRRYDSVESGKKDFTVDQTPAGPIIWCLDPDNGPNFINLTVYGENFGSPPGNNSGRGVFFTMPADATPTAATLVNTGGTPGGSCPAGGWSGKKICVQAPGEAVSGQVKVKTDCQGIDCASNPKFFTIGSCQAPAVLKLGGKEINNPAHIGCATLKECCGDGVCRSSGACQTIKVDSAYGWEFSTKPTEIYPEVVKECLADFVATKETAGRFPSPSPWMGWKGGEDVCLNAQVSARFGAVMDPATLTKDNVILEECQGVETNNLLANGGFEVDLSNSPWQVIDQTRLAVTQVAAPQDDLPDDGQIADGTTKALRLEKLQAEPDRGLGESAPEKKDGNQYQDSFGLNWLTGFDSYDKEYKFSAKVKAAKTKDGKITAIGQKAGLLSRKVLSDGTVVEEKIMEVILKDDWQDISVSQSFGPNVGTVEIRLFLTSPPAGAKVTDFYKYAAYFDDLKINDLQSVNCQGGQRLAAVLQAQPDNKQAGDFNGFTLMPGAGGRDELKPNTWHRVTLKIGLKALSKNGLTGKNMKENAARCGQGNGDCWLFKTGGQTCLIKNVWVLPTPYTSSYKGEKINYSALAGGEDVCLSLNPQGLDWTWKSSDSAKALLNSGLSGKACQYDFECPIGPEAVEGKQGSSCLQNHCWAMPWTATATALAETLLNKPAQIIAQAKEKSNPSIIKDGEADLNIHFIDPEVVDYWPACQAACLNAAIGLRFNVAMSPATLLKDNFKVTESACGNGSNPLDQGEQCDDGNMIDGDGCSSGCLLEGTNYQDQCGNGHIDLGEDCDDNNVKNGDGCSFQCLNEGTAAPDCGNGQENSNEECDDGNTKDGDGCSAKCLNEGTRVDIAVCGNGRVEKGEECEKNASGFSNGCDGACLLKGTGLAVEGGLCGNGAVDPGEQCDPKSKLLDTPAKRALCGSHCLWTGTFKPTVAGGPGCGNGKQELGEACDDGNTKNNDGCSEICLNEGAKTTTVPVCGNDKQEYGEDCDDNNIINGDGCSAKCLNEGTGKSICGNGMVDKGEACDLGIKGEVEWSAQKCDRIVCLKTGTLAKVDQDGKAICGNNKIDAGEDCDTAVAGQNRWCGNNCLWKGRGGASVSLAEPVIIFSEQQEAVGVSLSSVNLLLPYTQYTVTAGALRSASGKILPDFTWNFTTKGEQCAVSQVDINPASVTLYAVGATAPYSSAPRSKPDVCSTQGQRLNASSYDWGWSSANQEVATVEHLENTPSQTAQATARGLSRQDIAAKKIASVTQIKAEISNDGEDKGKSGMGDLAVVCGWKDDAACAAANNNNQNFGRGDDTCCYRRPTVTKFEPEQKNNLCPNGLLSVTFSALMNQVSQGGLINNFVLARQAAGSCPEGAQQVNMYGETETVKADQVWCAGEIKLNLTANNDDFDKDGRLETKVIIQPSKLLRNNTNYRLIVRGDTNFGDDKKEGIENIFGVALDAVAGGTVWNLKTGQDVCKISAVKIQVAEPQDKSGDKTLIKKSGAERDLTARAFTGVENGGQEIVPINGVYDWTWQWGSSDDQAEVATLTPVSTNPQNAQLKAKDKNGEAVVTATANITDKTAGQETPSAVSGSQKFTIFICENPWPRARESVFPYQDLSAPATNFSTFYCRDAGQTGEDDDLPDLRPVVLTHTGQVSGGQISAAAKEVVFKEFLFTIPDTQDAIGIRVMQNPKWLSAALWYKDQGFIGDPQPLEQAIDGYDAVQDGTTVYVAAANDDNGIIYSNVYLISYNADASKETKNIRDQIVNNFHLNINLSDNQRICKNSGKPCRQDVACGSGDSCQAPKDKLLRDVQRVKDMMSVAQSLQDYRLDEKKGNGSYPRLEAGSYLRGLTNTKWPSWSAVLGNALGTSLPDDPLGQPVGLYKCEGTGYSDTGFAKDTCWNEKEAEFRCPPGSQIYQYRNVGPNKFELSANFEYAIAQGNWVGFTQPAGNDFVLSYCAAPSGSLNLQGFCGDGKMGVNEACDRGQTRIVSCTPPDGGLKTEICSDKCDGWGPITGSVCTKAIFCGNGRIDSGEICDDGELNNKYGKCNEGCFKKCIGGTKDKKVCSENVDCPSGVCSGLTAYCGDGKRNGPEICDDGTENGQYGKCRLDCSGSGSKCGDKKVNSDYGEECEVGQKKTAKGYCAGGTKELGPCDSNDNCPGGGACQPCPQYTRCSKDSNKICSTDNDCAPDLGACVKQQFVLDWQCSSSSCKWTSSSTVCYPSSKPLCGNGNKDAGEQCDDDNTNDNDGCTNECKLPVCGDGKAQSDKICQSGDSGKKYQNCEKDSDCGKDGKCYAKESCDAGANNGKICAADYGAVCVYCDKSCQKAYVQGSFCGDKVQQYKPEICDWADGTNQDAAAAKNYQSVEEFDPTKSVCAENCLSKCPDSSGGYAKGVLKLGTDKAISYKFNPDTQANVQLPNDCRLISGADGLKLNLKFSRNNVKNNEGAGVTVILATDAGANADTARTAATTLINSLCDQYKKLNIGLVFKESVPTGVTPTWNTVTSGSCSDPQALINKVPTTGPSGLSGGWVYTADALDNAKTLIPQGGEQDSLIILLSDGDPKANEKSTDDRFEDLDNRKIQTVVVNIQGQDSGCPAPLLCSFQMEKVWARDNIVSGDDRPYIVYNNKVQERKSTETVIEVIRQVIKDLVEGVTVTIKTNGNTLSQSITEYGEMIFPDSQKLACRASGTMSVFFIASLLDNRQVEINGTLDYCQGPPFACVSANDCPPDSGYKCSVSGRCVRERPPAPPPSGYVWCGVRQYDFNSPDTCGNCVDDQAVVYDCTRLGYNHGYSGNFLTCQNNQCVCDSQRGYATNGVCPTGYPRCSKDTFYSCATAFALDQITQARLFTCVLPKSEQCNWGCASYGCKSAPCNNPCQGRVCGSPACGSQICGSCLGNATCTNGQCEQVQCIETRGCFDGQTAFYSKECPGQGTIESETPCSSGQVCDNGQCVNAMGNTCSDDDGQDHEVRGTVKGVFNGASYNNIDSCINNQLFEYFCSVSNTPITEKVTCLNNEICQDGRCCLGTNTVCSNATGCLATRDCCSGSGRNVCTVGGICTYKCY
ncbi:MAG: hypothetical protein Q8M83_06090 [bacterium]|nr:hypothetical protein [bacterium]